MRVTTLSPTDAVDRALDRIAADGRDGIWIALVERDTALDAARVVERRVAAGEHLPLAGATLAVKNNIDVAGLPTTAGCPAFAHDPETSAPVVAALVDAGAVVIGVTNMDQFATGLVGTRSPYGICPNAHHPGLVSGGSSSGSAVAVAAGHVDLALGTDTAGSGRIPAAANGIVGLKPTRGWLSTRGTVPACASLDCVAMFASNVDTAARATAIAGGRDPDPADPWSRPRPASRVRPDRSWRIGVPDIDSLTFDGDDAARAAFASAIAAITRLDLDVVPIDVSPLIDCGRLLYDGAFVAERYTAVGRFVDDHPDEVDPVVGRIISASSRHTAADLFDDLARLEGFRRQAERMWGTDGGIDMVVVPSAPRIPTIAEVLAEPIAVNSMLGTYTNFVNLLDQCALAVPVAVGESSPTPSPHATFVGRAWDDAALVDVASRLGPA